MKKSLSILLALLMVLSTVTCMFTMPASAEEAATGAPAAVETLPVNDWITNNGTKTITPETTFTVSGVTFPTSVNYGIRGWDQKKDDEGNVISGTDGARLTENVLHQLTLTVTASEDINEGVKLYPVFHSNDSMNHSLNQIAGVRSDVTTPLKVETAYNSVTASATSDKTVPTTNADNAVALVAGKTYTYTYLFRGSTKWINHIRMFADGLTTGSVTLSDAKIFPASETDAGNFLFKNAEVIPYAVEENGNVFIRMYGYQAIGSTAIKKYQISAKLGGDYYNIDFIGGKTYQLSFDARYTSEQGFHDSDSLGRSPAFDFYETGSLDYSAEYDAIRAEGDETVYKLDGGASATERQREYSGPNNGYSYFYAGSTSSTSIRRVTASNIGTMAYYNADGALIANRTQGAGSQHGRTFKNEINTSTWIKGEYTLNAVGAQTLQEAATLGATKSSSTNANMRYTYADSAWTFNSGKTNWYVPAKQDVTVALGIEFLNSAQVYDFDNFAITTDVTAVPVEYKNANGETDTLANTKHTANKYYDALADKTIAAVHLFESDTLTFDGWYNGTELVSTDTEFETTDSYADLKAVFTSKNLLAYAGGFENYAANTNLEAAYTVVKAGTEPYPNYTAGEFRYYNSVPPTGDKWTGWDTNINTTKLKDSDNGVTTAKIIEDIEAAGGVMNTSGYTGFSYFTGFPTIKSAVASERIYADSGNHSSQAQYITVTPYSGDKMLQMQASARTAIRALEGLTAGKTYTLSFYAFNPYKDYWIKDVTVRTQPNLTADSEILGAYSEPWVDVTEDRVTGDNGATTSKTFSRIANMDHVQKWFKIELTFTATDTVAYFTIYNQYPAYTGGHTFIDELTLVEYDCQGNHIYDDFSDTQCNICGATREFLNEWSFEDGVMENITVKGTSKLEVVDAVNQPEKIGSKYLEYTSAGFDGMAFNFMYEQGYKYKISYDFKIFTYGTGPVSNGIDHVLLKFDDGLYGANNQTNASLNPYYDNIVTRYYENGKAFQKVTCFNHEAGNDFYGRKSHKETVTNEEDGTTSEVTVYDDAMVDIYGGALWDEWQRVEIEVGSNNDYEGLVEFGIRPNDAGWVVGVDNFKVEKVSTAIIGEANDATDGTYAFNIRAKTDEKKQGLRFKSTIDLDKLNLADGAKIVEYGTLAIKEELRNQGFRLVRQAAKDTAVAGHVIAGIAYNEADDTDIRYAIDETNNVLTYTGVLTGIGVKNYDVDFAVRGYAVIELADGTRTTVYDEIVVLSVYDAAQQIIEENANAEDVAIAQTVVNAYNNYVG